MNKVCNKNKCAYNTNENTYKEPAEMLLLRNIIT